MLEQILYDHTNTLPSRSSNLLRCLSYSTSVPKMAAGPASAPSPSSAARHGMYTNVRPARPDLRSTQRNGSLLGYLTEGDGTVNLSNHRNLT